MKNVALALVLATLFSCSPQEIQSVLGSLPSTTALSNDEVISGLKEALRLSAERSVQTASVADGFSGLRGCHYQHDHPRWIRAAEGW
ncbi:MAG: hypothetical protein IPH05_04085 [Flavobacteriales bacterium]|nr:hypothetical protein [Flavobacteriales bacterium]